MLAEHESECDRGVERSLRLLLQAFFLVGLMVGCARNDASSTSVQTCLGKALREPVAELPGIELVLCPMAESYTPDRVEVLVAIQNKSSQPYLIDARLQVFGHLTLSVVDPQGDVSEPKTSWEPPSVRAEAEPYFQWVLPRGGIIGRVINLSCDFEELEMTTEGESCHPLFSFHAGQYQLRAKLNSVLVCEDIPCSPDNEWRGTLEAPAIEINVEMG